MPRHPLSIPTPPGEQRLPIAYPGMPETLSAVVQYRFPNVQPSFSEQFSVLGIYTALVPLRRYIRFSCIPVTVPLYLVDSNNHRDDTVAPAK